MRINEDQISGIDMAQYNQVVGLTALGSIPEILSLLIRIDQHRALIQYVLHYVSSCKQYPVFYVSGQDIIEERKPKQTRPDC